MAHITRVFERALGARVADFSKGGPLGQREIEAIRESYIDWLSQPDSFSRSENELWPLISHHDDVRGNVVLRNFVAGAGSYHKKNPTDELNMHLVACNGVVLADPLRRIFFTDNGQPIASPDSDHIHRVAARLADIEPFIDDDIVQISTTHPLLSDEKRQAWIAPFNLGHNLRVITDLIEEGHFPDPYQSDETIYQRKVDEVLRACGVLHDIPEHLPPLDRLMAFARALMEVSWQLAHATETHADLYLTSKLERRIFEVLIEDCQDELNTLRLSASNGAHLQMLATVGLPLLDSSSVNPDDIVEIRAGEAFSQWRNTLNVALDTYAMHASGDGPDVLASRAFGNQLRQARDQLDAAVNRNASLSKTFKKGLVALSFGVAGAGWMQLANDSHTMLEAVGAMALPLSATLMHDLLTGRSRSDAKAHQRFFAAFDL